VRAEPEAPLKAPDQGPEAPLKAPDQGPEAPLKAPDQGTGRLQHAATSRALVGSGVAGPAGKSGDGADVGTAVTFPCA
jgi:hypothetical protein